MNTLKDLVDFTGYNVVYVDDADTNNQSFDTKKKSILIYNKLSDIIKLLTGNDVNNSLKYEFFIFDYLAHFKPIESCSCFINSSIFLYKENDCGDIFINLNETIFLDGYKLLAFHNTFDKLVPKGILYLFPYKDKKDNKWHFVNEYIVNENGLSHKFLIISKSFYIISDSKVLMNIDSENISFSNE